MKINELQINPTLQFGDKIIKSYARMNLRNKIIFWLVKRLLSLADTKDKQEVIFKVETG